MDIRSCPVLYCGGDSPEVKTAPVTVPAADELPDRSIVPNDGAFSAACVCLLSVSISWSASNRHCWSQGRIGKRFASAATPARKELESRQLREELGIRCC